MIKEIKYNGISSVPSDYEVPDGHLDIALNLIPEDGALKPIHEPEHVGLKIKTTEKLYIHKNNFTHYIILSNAADGVHIAWRDIDTPQCEDSKLIHIIPAEHEIRDIKSVGNMLIVSTTRQMYYYVWRNQAYGEEAGYTFIGNNVPDINMKFALKLNIRAKTYRDTGITTSEYVLSGDDAWTKIGAKSYKVHQGAEETIKQEFAPNLRLESNVEYDFRQTYKYSSDFVAEITLWGCKIGETEVIKITSWGGHAGRVTPQCDYDHISFTVRMKDNIEEYRFASGELVVYKGLAKGIGGIIVTYNKDNYEAVMAATNKFVAEEATNKNKFIYPFFVRYAIRLFDDSYVNVSDPILMIPNSGYVPFVHFNSINDKLDLYAYVADLQYSVAPHISSYSYWKDIIHSVEIFVSSPIYPYRQGQNFVADEQLFSFKSITYDESGSVILEDALTYLSQGYGAPFLDGYYIGDSDSNGAISYNRHNLFTNLCMHLNVAKPENSRDYKVVQVAARDNVDILKDIASVSTFYKVHEFAFDEEAEGVFRDIDIPDGKLKALTTQPVLEADSLSNSTPFDCKLFTFNGRLHCFDGMLKLPKVTPPNLQFAYTDKRHINGGTFYITDILVYVNTDDGEKVVRTSFSPMTTSPTGESPWFFYPHSGAYKAEFVKKSISDSGDIVHYSISTIKLKRHDFLYGAYFLAEDLDSAPSWDNHKESEIIDGEPSLLDDTSCVEKRSVIYVSEANNPLSFKSVNTLYMGNARIIALATTAKPISQGQYGKFPLYIFTNDGVWTPENSDIGTYISRQPLTRDVCINAASVTQLDDAVLFATDRGIMLIQGGNTICITDTIKHLDIAKIGTIPMLSDVIQLAGLQPLIYGFKDFAAVCEIVYDYSNFRIILFDKSSENDTCYVYSLKSRQWGQLQYDIRATVNGYPHAFVINKDGNLVDFSVAGHEDVPVDSFALTRPFKMDDPDMFKTIDTVIQRGVFKRDNIRQVLYASNDLYHWHTVWSSKDMYMRGFRGTPYKAFRLALICRLGKNESLFGCTVQFTPRLTNRPR